MVNQVYEASAKIALIVVEIVNLLSFLHEFVVQELDRIIESLISRVLVIVDLTSLKLRCILKSLINGLPI